MNAKFQYATKFHKKSSYSSKYDFALVAGAPYVDSSFKCVLNPRLQFNLKCNLKNVKKF